jgi:hypothetical protein
MTMHEVWQVSINSAHTGAWEIMSLCLLAARNMMSLYAVGNGLAGSCNPITAQPHAYFARYGQWGNKGDS